jgi:hypothetical protein
MMSKEGDPNELPLPDFTPRRKKCIWVCPICKEVKDAWMEGTLTTLMESHMSFHRTQSSNYGVTSAYEIIVWTEEDRKWCAGVGIKCD